MKAVFLSYDGALDPLGTSQVVACVLGLARRGVELTLISFEKAARWQQAGPRERTAARLREAAVRWRPLRYHKHPRLPATLWDILIGSRAVAAEVRRSGATLVHCRGDLSMAMARRARLPASTRLLYDARGFFSLERVEVGSWAAGGLIDRGVRRIEAANLRRADAIAVNTDAFRQILAAGRDPLPPVRVIPSFADLEAFRLPKPGAVREYSLVYCGSLGTWYKTKEMVDFARVASRTVPGRVLFLTPDAAQARDAGATPDWAEVRSLAPEAVPEWLRQARAQFFFIEPSAAKRASSPTKLGEGLATGLPCVANRGVGDLDAILEREAVGVLLGSFSESAYAAAAQQLQSLLADPRTAMRCRAVAEKRYSLEAAVTAYHELYAALQA